MAVARGLWRRMRACPPRLGVRLCSFVALGLTVALWPAAWRFVLPALSPFVAVCAAIALRTVSLVSLLALPVLALAVLRRRFWCRYLCPVGLVSEYCGKVGRNSGRRSGAALTSPAFPPGRFLALATLGGALLGYPLFLWMDPLALFSGAFSVSQAAHARIPLLSLIGLPTVILISLLFPGTWCARICPLGAAQDLLFLAQRIFRRRGADDPEPLPAAGFAGRRVFLALGVGTVSAALIPKAAAHAKPPLRPPGSVNETAFKAACIRCGNCWRACPTRIVKPAVAAGDVAGFLVPTLRFGGADYCLQDCNRCGQACPSGVIRPLPLKQKNRHVIGIARINLDDCLLTQDRECGVCLVRCPRGAILEVFSPQTYTTVVKVAEEKCNGCGACVGICPPKVVTVEAAIR